MNKVIIMGRLTRDPDVRYSQGANPTAVAKYSLAVPRKYKQDGQPDCDFINCIAFGKLGEFAESESNSSQQGNSAPEPMGSDGNEWMSIPDGIEELPFN